MSNQLADAQLPSARPLAPGPLRANHGLLLLGAAVAAKQQQPSPMRLYISRTQPQLHSALSTPVAKVQPMRRAAAIAGLPLHPSMQKLSAAEAPAVGVVPLKRPLSLAAAEVEDSRPPTPKQPRRCRPVSPAIVTNPRCRHRSREVASAAAAAAAPAASGQLLDAHQSAMANVPFPTLKTMATPTFQQTVAAGKRDAQTSPRHPVAEATEPSETPIGAGNGGGSGSALLTSWLRCKVAHLRRSLSTSRVDVAATKSTSESSAALSDAATPKRLFGGRKRNASLQRFVQRNSGSPVASSASCKKISSPVAPSSLKAVKGRVMKLMPDGSQLVRLKRPHGGKFGFFVSRQQSGVFITRFNDAATQRRYSSVIGVGDEILEFEGTPTAAIPFENLQRLISDKRVLSIRVRSCYAC